MEQKLEVQRLTKKVYVQSADNSLKKFGGYWFNF